MNLPANMIYLLLMMFCFGLLFGNVMSLAMVQMGEVAGAASSLIGALSTLIAIVVATLIGAQLTSNSIVLVVGFFVCSCVAWVLNYREMKVKVEVAN